MGLLNLMGKVGVSLEDVNPSATTTTTTTVTTPPANTSAPKPATEDTLVEETIVNPVDAPSAAIPVVADPVPPAPVAVEPLAPVEPAPVVVPEAGDVVVPVPPVVAVEPPVAEQVADAVAITEVAAQATQIEAEQCALRTKAEELLDIQTSLESLSGILSASGALGITKQTTQVTQVMLRDINRRLGKESEFVSTESFNFTEVRDRDQVASVALEDIRESVKVAQKHFLELIERIIAAFKKAAMNHLDGIAGLKREAKALEAELAKVKAEGGSGRITLGSASRLMVKGNVEREISGEIKGLAHFTATAYPEAVVEFLTGLVKGVLKFDPENAGIEEVKAYFEKYRKPLAFLIEQKMDTDDLPGGYKLDVSDGGLNVGIKRDSESSDASQEIDVDTTIRLRHVTRDIILVVNQLEDVRPEVDKISKASDKLVAAVKRAADKKGDDNEAAYQEMSSHVGKIIAQTNPRVGEIIGYLVRYCRMQLAVVRQQMNYIVKEAAKQSND